MPIDEVNEKFPMQKYKTWVASRARQGLSTNGGVSAPSSRPGSVRDADGVAAELPSKERMSTDDRPTTSATSTAIRAGAETANMRETPDTPTSPKPESKAEAGDVEQPEVRSPQLAPKESTSSSVAAAASRVSVDAVNEPQGTPTQNATQASQDEEDEEDHIHAALPPECVGTSGDTCAICIDTLEDDDDVRGLTCGHAFHAACIDPWLTTRRACCPLCKADYYTPKPRPPAADGTDGAIPIITVTLQPELHNSRRHEPSRPERSYLRFAPFAPSTRASRRDSREQQSQGSDRWRDHIDVSLLFGRSRRSHSNQNNNRSRQSGQSSSGAAELRQGELQQRAGGIFAGLRATLGGLTGGRAQSHGPQSAPTASGTNPTTPTPSQLEAGLGSAHH